MEKISINPLRLGLMVVLALLIAGSLFYRLWPSGYTLPLSASNQWVAETRGIDPYTFHSMVREPGFSGMVVDVRDQAAFSQEHLPEAVNIPFQQLLDRGSLRKLKGSSVLIYADREERAHQAALMLTMQGINARPVNGNFQLISAARLETGDAPLMFFSKEKVQYNYPHFFKALEPEPAQPAEIKVPLPKPSGC